MAVDRETVGIGTELPPFVRTTGFHNWNRYAAVNDEFVPIHMDDEAGRAQGFPGAFGMGNLMWAYLHNLVRDWMGDNGRIVSMGCSFRSPNLRGMTVEARGTVTAVRDEKGERIVDLELGVIDRDNPDTVLVPATATVALPEHTHHPHRRSDLSGVSALARQDLVVLRHARASGLRAQRRAR